MNASTIGRFGVLGKPFTLGKNAVFPLLCYALIALACFASFTWKNDFPYYYQTDEPIKVKQVLTNRPNFEHPLVLINTTRTLATLTATPAKPQAIVAVGRTASAMFAATAIFILMILAYHYAGFWGGICFGVPISLSTTILNSAHIMKEDTAMLMGISLVLLAATVFLSRRTVRTLSLLAVSCGFAASAKYPALALVALVGVLLIRLKPELTHLTVMLWGRTYRAPAIFLGLFSATALLFNYQVLLDIPQFIDGFLYEAGNVLFSRKDYVVEHSYLFYMKRFSQASPLPIQLFFGVYLLQFLATFRRKPLAEWLELAFLLLYFLFVFKAKIVSDRYYVPIELMVCYVSGKTMAQSFQSLQKQPFLTSVPLFARQTVSSLLFAGLILWIARLQWPHFTETLHDYGRDSRLELQQWVVSHLPESAVIAQDTSVSLPTPGYERHEQAEATFLPQTVLHARSVADLGTLAELRHRGITHIAINHSQYRVLLDKNTRPRKKKTVQFQQRKAFYQTLLAEGKLLWASQPGATILQPTISLYALPTTP